MNPSQQSNNFGTIADIMRQTFEELEQKAAAQRDLYERNRQNAQKSTGPKSDAGKAIACQNRLAHGLCSSSLIIRGESQEEFDALHFQTQLAFGPQTDEENILLDQMVEALWRLNRARSVESKAFERMMGLTDDYLSNGGAIETDQSTGGLLATALFDPNHQKVMTTVQRYVTAAERNYRACQKAFEAAIARRPETLSQQAMHEEEIPELIEKAKVATAGQTLYREEDTELPAWPAPAVPSFNDRC
jgi:hypothetical protein